MKTLSRNRAVRITTYFAALLLFATGCNWFGISSPFVVPDNPPDDSSAAADSSQSATRNNTAETNAAESQVNASASVDEAALEDADTDQAVALSPEAVIEATAAAIVAQLKEVDTSRDHEAKATAEAIVAQLAEVRDGLSNRRATVFHQGVIQEDLVNIRSGPDTGYAILAQVNAGQTLGVTGRNDVGDWLQVCCPAPDGEKGWLLASLLVVPNLLPDILTTVPVAEAPALPAAAAQSASVGSGGGFAAGLPANGGWAAPSGTNPLTGQALPPGRGNQRPVVVCINNDVAARPQLGMSQADVVYEYLMEGYGITRFSGIYYGTDAAQVGPIRSARLINVYLEALYDAGLVCSGASDRVRYILKHESPYPYMDVDLDDPSNTKYSTNVGSDYRTRLRTDTSKLNRFLSDWGAQKPASIRGFTFGGLGANGASATNISIPYPGSSRAAYQYDSGRGLYLRSMGGTPHLDGNSGAQLALDNVIVQYVPHVTTDIVEDSLGSLSISLNLFGSGRAIVFRDGQAFDGTWRSESGGDMPHFFGSDGREIPLKPGRSWISIVPQSYGISFQ